MMYEMHRAVREAYRSIVDKGALHHGAKDSSLDLFRLVIATELF